MSKVMNDLIKQTEIARKRVVAALGRFDPPLTTQEQEFITSTDSRVSVLFFTGILLDRVVNLQRRIKELEEWRKSMAL